MIEYLGRLVEKPTDLLLVVFTGLLAFSTIRLWWATAGLFKETKGLRAAAEQQARDMKQSLETAASSSMAAEKAALAAEGSLKLTSDTTKRELQSYVLFHEIDVIKAEHPAKIIIRLRNFGKTPAIVQQFHLQAQSTLQGARGYAMNGENNYGVVPPGGTLQLEVDEQLAVMGENQKYDPNLFWISGFVAYLDAFAQVRRTDFLMEVKRTKNGYFRFVQDGNSAS